MLQRETATQMNQATNQATNLAGLWVLLVDNEGELKTQDAEGRVPVMARAGNDKTYLLVFKNVVKARQFVASSALDGAEPRMVVRGNRDDIVRIARDAGAYGTMLDYDPATQQYAGTGALA
ncbi:MAG: hypothetical protein H0X17_04385 [Deltaproteobacteria bacterium]|nr:hypothetical protein [Deltaproteobacteria bacterium]